MTKQLNETEKTLNKLLKASGRPLTLANMLWCIRKCEELTQREFGKMLGISGKHVCDIEMGRRIPTIQSALKYAVILGYNAKQFIRLTIQDQLNRKNLPFKVSVKDK